MKIRDSGMPEQAHWESFFDPAAVLKTLECPNRGDVADLGCGYGTFALAAARSTQGAVHAFDIDPAMIAIVNARARHEGISNLRAVACDFVAEGTDLGDSTVGYAMLFNVLHAEAPVALLREAYRMLYAGGSAAVVHWIHDVSTPRGPALEIRPPPEQCMSWARQAGFSCDAAVVALPPYHFGFVARKPAITR